MRKTYTFILRLLVDTDEPCLLRGVLHSVADNINYSFADGQALLDLLWQATSEAHSSVHPDDRMQERDFGDKDHISKENSVT